MGKNKTDAFKLRISQEDRENFEILARELKRSKSDAICFMAALWVEELKNKRPDLSSSQAPTHN